MTFAHDSTTDVIRRFGIDVGHESLNTEDVMIIFLKSNNIFENRLILKLMSCCFAIQPLIVCST